MCLGKSNTEETDGEREQRTSAVGDPAHKGPVGGCTTGLCQQDSSKMKRT